MSCHFISFHFISFHFISVQFSSFISFHFIHSFIHSFIDLFLVALIRVYSSMEQNKSQQCGPQPPKSTKNPGKIHPKSCQNPSQTHLRRKMRPRHVPKSTFLASWSNFLNFWTARALPKSSKNR